MTAIIEVSGLSLTFDTLDGPVYALSNVDLSIEPGDFVSLIGPSGCGKTTLMRALGGLTRPDEGTIRVGGREVHFASAADAGAAGIAGISMFQSS